MLDETQLKTLRVLASHLVPQPDSNPIDLAARVAAQLADGAGDGWRPDGSPPDREAYRLALDELREAVDGAPDELSGVLDDVAAGTRPTSGVLSSEQLQAWLEDATVDLVRQFIAHPATMAALDYDGFASGGDRSILTGFQILDAGAREVWEPGALREAPVGQTAVDDQPRTYSGGTR